MCIRTAPTAMSQRGKSMKWYHRWSCVEVSSVQENKENQAGIWSFSFQNLGFLYRNGFSQCIFGLYLVKDAASDIEVDNTIQLAMFVGGWERCARQSSWLYHSFWETLEWFCRFYSRTNHSHYTICNYTSSYLCSSVSSWSINQHVGTSICNGWYFHSPVLGYNIMRLVPKRDAATLLQIMESHVAPCTTVHSNQGSMYNRVGSLPGVAWYGQIFYWIQ